MRTLVIDTAGPALGIAAAENKTLHHSTHILLPRMHHVETLLPSITQALSHAGWSIRTIDAVIVNQGPGSFTGLRTGMATAKGIALALDIPIVCVDNLEALAVTIRNIRNKHILLVPVVDARKSRVYTAIFQSLPAHMDTKKGRAQHHSNVGSTSDAVLAACGIQRLCANMDIPIAQLQKYIAQHCSSSPQKSSTHNTCPQHAYRIAGWHLLPAELQEELQKTQPFPNSLVIPDSNAQESAVTGVASIGFQLFLNKQFASPNAAPHYLREGDVGANKKYASHDLRK